MPSPMVDPPRPEPQAGLRGDGPVPRDAALSGRQPSGLPPSAGGWPASPGPGRRSRPPLLRWPGPRPGPRLFENWGWTKIDPGALPAGLLDQGRQAFLGGFLAARLHGDLLDPELVQEVPEGGVVDEGGACPGGRSGFRPGRRRRRLCPGPGRHGSREYREALPGSSAARRSRALPGLGLGRLPGPARRGRPGRLVPFVAFGLLMAVLDPRRGSAPPGSRKLTPPWCRRAEDGGTGSVPSAGAPSRSPPRWSARRPRHPRSAICRGVGS
ncbi:MAG: hypothetical protein MZV64_09860 [Ignavibacteriales bacterium]|nr:hypothetical protein [Ignavibacteriales bacterium]